MKITKRAQEYIDWMNELNRIGKSYRRTYLRNKFTWRAFRQGLTPKQYANGLGHG